MIMRTPSTFGRSLALTGFVVVILHPIQAAQTPGDTQTLGAKAVIACAPRLSTATPDTSLTIIGSQEGTAKDYYGPSDTLVIGGGHAQGVDVGREYFVRRVVSLGQVGAGAPLVLHTAGWIRIVDAERDAAIASVVRACDALQRGDFLEVAEWPAEAPVGPPRCAGLRHPRRDPLRARRPPLDRHPSALRAQPRHDARDRPRSAVDDLSAHAGRPASHHRVGGGRGGSSGRGISDRTGATNA